MFPLEVEQILDDWQEPRRERKYCQLDKTLQCIDKNLRGVLKEADEYIWREFAW